MGRAGWKEEGRQSPSRSVRPQGGGGGCSGSSLTLESQSEILAKKTQGHNDSIAMT